MSSNNIPKKIYEVDLNNFDLIQTLTQAIQDNTIDNLVGKDWFELSDDEVVDAEHLLIWLNVCDRLNRLQSVFAYIPFTNENGQSFTASPANIGTIYIPVRDNQGRAIMDTDLIFGPRPRMVAVNNVALPPIDLSKGPDALNWFEHGEINNKANIANISYIDKLDINKIKSNRQKVNSINPTNDFITKLAFRQQGITTVGYPVVETVYLPMWTSDNREKSQRIDIAMAVEWNSNEGRLEFTKDSYSFIKDYRNSLNRQSWNTTTRDAIQLDTNLEAIANKIKDPVKRKEYYKRINEFAEEVIATGNTVDNNEFLKPKTKIVKKPSFNTKKKKTAETRGRKPKTVEPQVVESKKETLVPEVL